MTRQWHTSSIITAPASDGRIVQFYSKLCAVLRLLLLFVKWISRKQVFDLYITRNLMINTENVTSIVRDCRCSYKDTDCEELMWRTMAEASSSSSGSAPVNNIVKEGWLFKRGEIINSFSLWYNYSWNLLGEHIKNWRQRYFILKEDGQFIGFRSKPTPQDLNDPLNNFTVKGTSYKDI